MQGTGSNSASYNLYCKKKGPLFRVIAFITLWSFLFSVGGGNYLIENARAADYAGPTSAGSASSGSPVSFKTFNPETFILPAYLGHVQDSWVATSTLRRARQGGLAQGEYELSPKAIIHIQDAHCNYGCQHKVADIIEYLNKEYGIKSVNLEGGKGAYDLSPFTRIEDGKIRKKVSDYFLKESLINGAEYFAANNPERIHLWGIEDAKLYMENLNVYRESLKNKEAVDKYLSKLTHILNNLKRHIYSDKLFELDEKYTLYKADELEFKDYLTYLAAKASALSIDVKPLANIYLLNQSLKLESEIDFKKANEERGMLIDALNKKLSRVDTEELILKTVGFKGEKVSPKEFYSYLTDKARYINYDLAGLPNLSKYIAYISLYDAIDKAKIQEELAVLEDAIKNSLYENETQKELNALSKNLALMKNIFNISISKEDYEYYLKNKNAFDALNYTRFIKKQAPLYRIKARLDRNIDDLDAYRDNLARFYECSFKRDKAFLNNIKRGQVSIERGQVSSRDYTLYGNLSPSKATILITGGFHTENLAELFKKNNISYVSIIPNFKNGKDYKCPYFNLLDGKPNSVMTQLQTELHDTLAIASFLNSEPDLAQYAHGENQRLAFDLLCRWRENVEKDKQNGGLVLEGAHRKLILGRDGVTDTVPINAETINVKNIIERAKEISITPVEIEPALPATPDGATLILPESRAKYAHLLEGSPSDIRKACWLIARDEFWTLLTHPFSFAGMHGDIEKAEQTQDEYRQRVYGTAFIFFMMFGVTAILTMLGMNIFADTGVMMNFLVFGASAVLGTLSTMPAHVLWNTQKEIKLTLPDEGRLASLMTTLMSAERDVAQVKIALPEAVLDKLTALRNINNPTDLSAEQAAAVALNQEDLAIMINAAAKKDPGAVEHMKKRFRQASRFGFEVSWDIVRSWCPADSAKPVEQWTSEEKARASEGFRKVVRMMTQKIGVDEGALDKTTYNDNALLDNIKQVLEDLEEKKPLVAVILQTASGKPELYIATQKVINKSFARERGPDGIHKARDINPKLDNMVRNHSQVKCTLNKFIGLIPKNLDTRKMFKVSDLLKILEASNTKTFIIAPTWGGSQTQEGADSYLVVNDFENLGEVAYYMVQQEKDSVGDPTGYITSPVPTPLHPADATLILPESRAKYAHLLEGSPSDIRKACWLIARDEFWTLLTHPFSFAGMHGDVQKQEQTLKELTQRKISTGFVFFIMFGVTAILTMLGINIFPDAGIMANFLIFGTSAIMGTLSTMPMHVLWNMQKEIKLPLPGKKRPAPSTPPAAQAPLRASAPEALVLSETRIKFVYRGLSAPGDPRDTEPTGRGAAGYGLYVTVLPEEAASGFARQRGAVYKMQLLVPENHLLDYWKKLSEQSQEIQNALSHYDKTDISQIAKEIIASQLAAPERYDAGYFISQLSQNLGKHEFLEVFSKLGILGTRIDNAWFYNPGKHIHYVLYDKSALGEPEEVDLTTVETPSSPRRPGLPQMNTLPIPQGIPAAIVTAILGVNIIGQIGILNTFIYGVIPIILAFAIHEALHYIAASRTEGVYGTRFRMTKLGTPGVERYYEERAPQAAEKELRMRAIPVLFNIAGIALAFTAFLFLRNIDPLVSYPVFMFALGNFAALFMSFFGDIPVALKLEFSESYRRDFQDAVNAGELADLDEAERFVRASYRSRVCHLSNRQKFEEDVVEKIRGGKKIRVAELDIQNFKGVFNDKGDKLKKYADSESREVLGHLFGNFGIQAVADEIEGALKEALSGTGAKANVYNDAKSYYAIIENIPKDVEGSGLEVRLQSVLQSREFKGKILKRVIESTVEELKEANPLWRRIFHRRFIRETKENLRKHFGENFENFNMYSGISELSGEKENTVELAHNLIAHAEEAAKFAQIDPTGKELSKINQKTKAENGPIHETLAAYMAKTRKSAVTRVAAYDAHAAAIKLNIHLCANNNLMGEWESNYGHIGERYDPEDTYAVLAQNYREAIAGGNREAIQKAHNALMRKRTLYIPSKKIAEQTEGVIFSGEIAFKDIISLIIRTRPKKNWSGTFRTGGDEFGKLIWDAEHGTLQICEFDANNLGVINRTWGAKVGSWVIYHSLRIIEENKDLRFFTQEAYRFFNNMNTDTNNAENYPLRFEEKEAQGIIKRLQANGYNTREYLETRDGHIFLKKAPPIRAAYQENGEFYHYTAGPTLTAAMMTIDTNLIPLGKSNRDFSVIRARLNGRLEKAKLEIKKNLKNNPQAFSQTETDTEAVPYEAVNLSSFKKIDTHPERLKNAEFILNFRQHEAKIAPRPLIAGSTRLAPLVVGKPYTFSTENFVDEPMDDIVKQFIEENKGKLLDQESLKELLITFARARQKSGVGVKTGEHEVGARLYTREERNSPPIIVLGNLWAGMGENPSQNEIKAKLEAHGLDLNDEELKNKLVEWGIGREQLRQSTHERLRQLVYWKLRGIEMLREAGLQEYEENLMVPLKSYETGHRVAYLPVSLTRVRTREGKTYTFWGHVDPDRLFRTNPLEFRGAHIAYASARQFKGCGNFRYDGHWNQEEFDVNKSAESICDRYIRNDPELNQDFITKINDLVDKITAGYQDRESFSAYIQQNLNIPQPSESYTLKEGKFEEANYSVIKKGDRFVLVIREPYLTMRAYSIRALDDSGQARDVKDIMKDIFRSYLVWSLEVLETGSKERQGGQAEISINWLYRENKKPIFYSITIYPDAEEDGYVFSERNIIEELDGTPGFFEGVAFQTNTTESIGGLSENEAWGGLHNQPKMLDENVVMGSVITDIYPSFGKFAQVQRDRMAGIDRMKPVDNIWSFPRVDPEKFIENFNKQSQLIRILYAQTRKSFEKTYKNQGNNTKGALRSKVLYVSAEMYEGKDKGVIGDENDPEEYNDFSDEPPRVIDYYSILHIAKILRFLAILHLASDRKIMFEGDTTLLDIFLTGLFSEADRDAIGRIKEYLFANLSRDALKESLLRDLILFPTEGEMLQRTVREFSNIKESSKLREAAEVIYEEWKQAEQILEPSTETISVATRAGAWFKAVWWKLVAPFAEAGIPFLIGSKIALYYATPPLVTAFAIAALFYLPHYLFNREAAKNLSVVLLTGATFGAFYSYLTHGNLWAIAALIALHAVINLYDIFKPAAAHTTVQDVVFQEAVEKWYQMREDIELRFFSIVEELYREENNDEFKIIFKGDNRRVISMPVSASLSEIENTIRNNTLEEELSLQEELNRLLSENNDIVYRIERTSQNQWIIVTNALGTFDVAASPEEAVAALRERIQTCREENELKLAQEHAASENVERGEMARNQERIESFITTHYPGLLTYVQVDVRQIEEPFMCTLVLNDESRIRLPLNANEGDIRSALDEIPGENQIVSAGGSDITQIAMGLPLAVTPPASAAFHAAPTARGEVPKVVLDKLETMKNITDTAASKSPLPAALAARDRGVEARVHINEATGVVTIVPDSTELIIPDEFNAMKSADRERVQTTLRESMKKLGDQQGSIINIEVDEDLSGMDDMALFTPLRNGMNGVKKLASENIRSYDLGVSIVNVYVGSKKGRQDLAEKIIEQMKDKGIQDANEMKKRVVTFTFAEKESPEAQAIEEVSFTSYLQPMVKTEKGKLATLTPVDRCFTAGIRVLNAFEHIRLGHEQGVIDNAVEKAIRSIIEIGGAVSEKDQAKIEQLIERASTEGLIKLSGFIFVQIRPVDWNEITNYHEAMSEVLQAL